MPSTDDSISDFKSAVARHFAGRPTLRQVVSKQLLRVLLKQHPWLEHVQPALADADPFTLDCPDPSADYWTTKPLVDLVLQSLLEGSTLDLEPLRGRDYFLGLDAPYRFAGSTNIYEGIRLKGGGEFLTELLLELPDLFAQAQADYWRAEGAAGKSRDVWLQLLLKMALLCNLPLHNLDDQQQACIRGLLKGGSSAPPVFAVQVNLSKGEQRSSYMQAGLLVSGEWDERQVVLWCSPSSEIKAFDSLDDFAVHLRDVLARDYPFDAMTWDRYQLQGDVFAKQSALLLNNMLDQVSRVRYRRLGDVAQMEQLYAEISDPSQWFIDGYSINDVAGLRLPPGLMAARAADSFSYQAALFNLALEQLDSQDEAPLEAVLDLYSYARQQLREQMLVDHPVDANYFSDDLILEFKTAAGVPGGAATGTGGGEPLTAAGRKTLTEFAIDNLSSLTGKTITGITHRDEQLIMDWMNVEYVLQLVEKVDIGGRYPSYVAGVMTEPATLSLRTARFAREWRQSLIFAALSAKLDSKISDAGLKTVVDFCQGNVDSDTPNIVLTPLAFERQPNTQTYDLVQGMYVIVSQEIGTVLLYRPLYTNEPIQEFLGLRKMMVDINASASLQQSMLTWMKADVRHIYDHGGFAEPHITHIGADPFDLPEKPKRAEFSPSFWLTQVDEQLYKANLELLLELADRQSTSDAQSRWAILTQGAWLLFSTVTLVLTGPAAVVAWLVQTLADIEQQVASVAEGSAFDRGAALVNLILNSSMVLMHASLPKTALPTPAKHPEVAVEQPHSVLWPLSDGLGKVPVQGRVGLPGSLSERSANRVDFTWQGEHGFNSLSPTQRQLLTAMRTEVSLQGLPVQAVGSSIGTYLFEGHYYVDLQGDVYQVEIDDMGAVRIVNPQGGYGPWLTFKGFQWRIDGALRLLGGSGRGARNIAQVRRQNAEDFNRLVSQINELLHARTPLTDAVMQGRHSLQEANKDLDTAMALEGNLFGVLGAEQVQGKAMFALRGHLRDLIKLDGNLDNLYTQRLEARFVKVERPVGFPEQRSFIRQSLIESLLEMQNQIAQALNDVFETLSFIRPETPDQVQAYQRHLNTQKLIVGLDQAMTSNSEECYRRIEETIRDESIIFRDHSGTRIDKREYLKVAIDNRQGIVIGGLHRLVFDLGELCVDRLADVDADVIGRIYQTLAGDDLHSACSAHANHNASELTVSQSIRVLRGVQDSYDEIIASAVGLMHERGTPIHTSWLSYYLQQLNSLWQLVTADLEAVRGEALEAPPVSIAHSSLSEGGKRKLARTRKGRLVPVVSSQTDGAEVVVQRDSTNKKVLKTFHKEGDDFVEDASQPEPVPEQPAAVSLKRTRARARQLLNNLKSNIGQARQFIKQNQSLSFATEIDRHITDLQEVLSRLPRAEDDAALIETLGAAVEQLQQLRRSELTQLYQATRQPTANSLRFLHEENRLDIRPTTRRKMLSARDFLDVYEIRLRPPIEAGEGKLLWEAHFHYETLQAASKDFFRGHLKLAEQGKMGRKTQERVARTGQDWLVIYRGEVWWDQVSDVIPFPAD